MRQPHVNSFKLSDEMSARFVSFREQQLPERLTRPFKPHATPSQRVPAPQFGAAFGFSSSAASIPTAAYFPHLTTRPVQVVPLSAPQFGSHALPTRSGGPSFCASAREFHTPAAGINHSSPFADIGPTPCWAEPKCAYNECAAYSKTNPSAL